MPKKATGKTAAKKQPARPAEKRATQSVPYAPAQSRVAATQPSLSTRGAVVTVSHREYVGSVTNGSNTGFYIPPLCLSAPGYDLNPASRLMFPWLSNIAVNFERFTFAKLVFHFVPNQSASTAGRFYAAIDYDYDDIPYSDKNYLMANRTSLSVPCWSEATLTCDPAAMHADQASKYVSASSRGNYVEPRTAFCGFLLLGFDSSSQCTFDVTAEYVVPLSVPELAAHPAVETSTTAQAAGKVYQFNAGASQHYTLPTLSATPAGSPIRRVVCGEGACPKLIMEGSTGAIVEDCEPRYAYDIVGATNGLLNMFTKARASDVQLSDCTQNDCGAGVWNALGDYLGDLNSISGPRKIVGSSAADVPGDNKDVFYNVSTFLSAIRTAYPSVRYISPWGAFINALTIGEGAGYSTSYFNFEL